MAECDLLIFKEDLNEDGFSVLVRRLVSFLSGPCGTLLANSDPSIVSTLIPGAERAGNYVSR